LFRLISNPKSKYYKYYRRTSKLKNQNPKKIQISKPNLGSIGYWDLGFTWDLVCIGSIGIL
jgi:hypothetical protein